MDIAAERVALQPAVLPPGLRGWAPSDVDPSQSADEDCPQSISGLLCIIAYRDHGDTATERLITCRRYDLIGTDGYVGAVCHDGYRQFRCDRIVTVSDAQTGEVLGGGEYFGRFVVDGSRPRAETWGLTPGRKAILVSGLNILAFMARCDGHWHDLEHDVVEDFVCSLWMRQEWEGEPPLAAILAHARRLAPDGDTFERSVKCFARSGSLRRVISQFVQRIIAADGIIQRCEFDAAREFDELLQEMAA